MREKVPVEKRIQKAAEGEQLSWFESMGGRRGPDDRAETLSVLVFHNESPPVL